MSFAWLADLMPVLWIIGQIALGLAIADFVSGFFHWLEDSYGDPNWPIIGPIVIEPNIRHHYSPMDFARNTYWMRNRVVIGLAVIFGLAFWGLGWINVVSVSALVAGSHANETHRWAHLPLNKVPRIVALLQKSGLLIRTRHHWQHHTNRLDSHYCTITNFVNPLLDKARVFRRLERIIQAVTGISPREVTLPRSQQKKLQRLAGQAAE